MSEEFDNNRMDEIGQKEDHEEQIELVRFKVGDEYFGLFINDVQEISKVPHITRLPKTPNYMLGVINVRGQVIPVFDLRIRFNLDIDDYTFNDLTRVLIVENENKKAGLIVSSISKVIRLPKNEYDASPDISKKDKHEYVSGVAKAGDDLILVLDVAAVLEEQDTDIFEMLTFSVHR